MTISSGKTSKQRRIDELLDNLKPSDILIVTELSRLGRSTSEVLTIVNTLIEKQVQGIKLGKPSGTIQKSKFDKDKDRIVELLNLGLSVRKIAKLMKYNNHISLNTYVNKRKLKDNIALI